MLFYLGSIDNDYATLIINPMAKLENDKLIEVDLPTIKIASNFENRFTTSDAQKCYICYIDTENDIYSVEKNGKNQAQINAKKITLKDPSLEKIYEVIDISLTNTNMDQFRRKKPYYLSSYDTPVTDRIFIENGEYLYGPFIWNDLNRSSDKIEIIPEVKDINNQYSIYRLKKSKVNNYVSEFQLTHSFTDSRSSKFICFDIESMTTIIESYDFIDDESLKSIFAQKMSSEQIEKSMRQSIQSKIKNMDTSLFTDERKNRMLQMSIDTFNNDDFISDFVKKALSNEDFWSEETDGVTKKIRTNLLGYINNNADEKEKFLKIEETKEQKEEELRAQNEQLEQLKNDKNVLLKEIEELKKNKENIEQKKVTTEMVQEKEKLISEIHELEEKLNLGNEIKDWEERRKDAEIKFRAAEMSNNQTIDKLKKEKEGIDGTIYELTKNGQKAIIEAYNNVAFNDVFSDMIVNCANNYAKSMTRGNTLKSPGTDIAREFSSAEECIKSIQEELKRYDHNEIANILICLSQGFLTVFAGKPGTGKTSFCERFAKVCGLDTSADNSEHTRFIELSVEKGWASKRDFIGYYNPINKSFDQTNSLVYPALKLLSQEQQNGISDYPFFIMLDEANLSPMEYYWSEFINVCDFDNNRAIDLGDSESCCIPNTLRFMATINYDSTTENLSPRLLDRAWVIDLDNEIDYNELYDDNIENASKMLSFAVMNEYFGANLSFDKQMDSQISKVVTSETMAKLDKIYDICKPYLSISPRVRKSILKYCYIANEKKLFDSNNINIALDYAISQRVLPLINGYGTGDNRYKTEFLDKLMETCNSYSLDKCCKILRQIISSGNNNMNYYNYFNR